MKIYIAMHKVVNLNIKSDLYEPLLVGSFNKKTEGILRDDDGINISSKNENYCELTGLYWIWKNSNEDIVGLCHYRRFLSKRALSNSEKYFLNENDINKAFRKKYNIILPSPSYYKNKPINENSKAPNLKDMQVMRGVVEKLYPDYLKEYDEFLEGKKAYLCNVMITKKEIMDKYCEWLFDILFETENTMNGDDYLNDPYRKRMFGFLSERLLNVWILHNKNDLKIKEYPLINIEEGFYTRLKRTSKNFIKKWAV